MSTYMCGDSTVNLLSLFLGESTTTFVFALVVVQNTYGVCQLWQPTEMNMQINVIDCHFISCTEQVMHATTDEIVWARKCTATCFEWLERDSFSCHFFNRWF